MNTMTSNTLTRKSCYLLFGLAITFVPLPALANAGTPLIWVGMVHLLIANLVIGYVEGGLLSRLFHTSRGKATGVLVIANYVSAWAGTFLLVGRPSHFQALTIENVKIWLLVLIILAFLLTLLIEYPFFWVLLKNQKNSAQKALRATLIVHGISYLLLLGFYGMSSQISMLTKLNVVSPKQLELSKEYVLYFKSSDDSKVIRADLTGENQSTIALSAFSSLPKFGSSFGPVPKLDPSSEWEYYTNVFARGGITGYKKLDNTRFRFSLETPFVFWSVSNATHFKGDFVVFQLGRSQICILQPQERKIALIARGKEPILVQRDSTLSPN